MASVATVAAVLRELREARRLSLAEAARRADVPRATLQHWEAGRHAPPGHALERLLDALRAEPGERAAILAQADPAHARLTLADSPLGPPIGGGAILRAMRLRARLTQGAVAASLGTTQGAVAKWESGDSVPGAETRTRLMAALGASEDEAAWNLRGEEVGGSLRTPEEARTRLNAVRLYAFQLDLGFGQEPLLLAYEAEVWERAVRDPRWEPALVEAMGWRALVLRFYLGRMAEGVELGGRALRLAKRCGAWNESAAALVAAAYVPSDPRWDFSVHAVPERAAHWRRDFERTEDVLARMTDPVARVCAQIGGMHHRVLGLFSPSALDETHRRTEAWLRPPTEPWSPVVMDRVSAAAHLAFAYLEAGRFDDADRVIEGTPWSEFPHRHFMRENLHFGRLRVYLHHGVEPTTGDLRLAEAHAAEHPMLDAQYQAWQRAYERRKRRR